MDQEPRSAIGLWHFILPSIDAINKKTKENLMTDSTKKKSLFLEPRKKFDPAENEILCNVCRRPLVVESYRWSKEEGAFFLSRRTDIPHKRCMKHPLS